MIEPLTLYAFLFISGALFASFIGDLIYRATNIPSILWLMIIGFILGPYMGILDPVAMREIQPIVGPIALSLVFFDAGLVLDIFKFFFRSVRPLFFSFVVVGFTLIGVAVVANALFGWNYLVGATLGAIFGGTGTAIVISLSKKLPVIEEVNQFLTVEGAITGVLAVVLTATLTDALIFGTADVHSAGMQIAFSLGKGLGLGFVIGVGWMMVLYILRDLEYSYMITLAVNFLTYAGSDYIGGNGPLSALIFGMVMGNNPTIAKMLRLKHTPMPIEKLKEFQSEIMFFLKAFFFIYLGTLINLGEDKTLLISGILVLVILVARIFAVFVSTVAAGPLSYYRLIISLMFTRGLKSAVLSTLPLTIVHNYMKTQPYIPQLYPLAYVFRQFPDIVFVVVGVSIILTTFLVTLWSLTHKQKKEAHLPLQSKIIHETELFE
ncbi:MAG: cation:proton antiporter [Candidatus Anstonellales archaeon]